MLSNSNETPANSSTQKTPAQLRFIASRTLIEEALLNIPKYLVIANEPDAQRRQDLRRLRDGLGGLSKYRDEMANDLAGFWPPVVTGEPITLTSDEAIDRHNDVISARLANLLELKQRLDSQSNAPHSATVNSVPKSAPSIGNAPANFFNPSAAEVPDSTVISDARDLFNTLIDSIFKVGIGVPRYMNITLEAESSKMDDLRTLRDSLEGLESFRSELARELAGFSPPAASGTLRLSDEQLAVHVAGIESRLAELQQLKEQLGIENNQPGVLRIRRIF